jgi:hypothetical protein
VLSPSGPSVILQCSNIRKSSDVVGPNGCNCIGFVVDVVLVVVSSIYCSYAFCGSCDLAKPLLPTDVDYSVRNQSISSAADKSSSSSFLEAWSVRLGSLAGDTKC